MIRIISENDVSQSGAIARYELELSPRSEAPLELMVRSSRAAELRASYSVTPGETKIIGVHLHLLPEGTQDISFHLKCGGKELGSVKRQLTVPKRDRLANKTRELLHKNESPVVFDGPCDSGYYPYSDPEAVAWFDRPTAGAHIDARLAAGEITSTEAELLRRFVEDGYMTIEGLINDELINAINKEIDRAIAEKHGGYEYGSSQRIEHLHFKHPNIRKLWSDERLARLASIIFEDRALPCQTLTFVFGSQQDAHQDTVHLTPFPAGYMCGIWVALQDVVPGSGELVVYPGSHREPRVYLRAANCPKVRNNDWSQFGQSIVPIWREMTKKYPEVVYRPRKGTALIWHENLLHGGSQRVDQSLERRSIVIHTFAKGAVVYYDSTGLVGTVAQP